MIKQNGNVYELHTDNTSYIFMVTESGHLEHIYYGARVHADVDAIREKHTFIPGNTKLKDTRAEVAELQKIRRCVDIALRADQPEQTQSRTKRQEQER